MSVLPDVDPALAELSWLSAACLGDVLPAEDPRAQRHLLCRNTLLRHRPAVVVEARCAHDVVASVRHAARTGVGLQVTATGRGATHPAAGGVLLSTARLTEVHVDAATATATVSAGVTWRMLASHTSKHGLLAVRGDDPDASVAGDVLSGCGGPWSREHGAPADAVRALEVVLTNGRVRRVTPDDGELFWALRGGGPGLAVVVTVELALVPAQPVTTGVLHAHDAASLIAKWSSALDAFPPSLSTAVELLAGDAGRALLHVFHLGPAQEAAALLRDLPAERQLVETLADPLDVGPRRRSGALCERDLLLSQPPGAVLHQALTACAARGQDLVVRHLGGRLSRQPPAPSAVTGRCARLSVSGCSQSGDVEPMRRLSRRLAPWQEGSSLPGVQVPDAGPRAKQECWTPEDWQRMIRLRAAVDPAGLLAR